MPTAHLEAHLERDLAELKRRLRLMGNLVLRALDRSVKALGTGDRKLAYAVVLDDNRIDALEGHIDRLCQEFLVRHMPVAAHLRFVVAAIKVNAELERIGDYADAIARRTISLAGTAPSDDRFFAMAKRAHEMVSLAVDAFVDGNVDKAERTRELEAEVDDMNRIVFDQLSHPDTGEQDLTERFALLGILNRIERVADRACNIAEDALYASRAEVHRHHPRDELRVLFLSPADATLGPMAEAIARRRAPLRVTFATAGISPRPLDPRMVAYMAEKGFDITRPRARGLADVGPLDDYYVVVTISREAEEGCPPLPYRTVQLFWDIPDPSKVEGTPQEIKAAYAATYAELDAKITDLLDAMLGSHDHEEIT